MYLPKSICLIKYQTVLYKGREILFVTVTTVLSLGNPLTGIRSCVNTLNTGDMF